MKKKNLVTAFLAVLLSPPLAASEEARQPASSFLSQEQLTELVEKIVQPAEAPAKEQPRLPVAGRISSPVGLRHDPINGMMRMHKGIDIAIPEGTPVKPIAPGKVIYSGRQGGYGNLCIVQHDDSMVTLYAHNSKNLATPGSRVDTTTPLALSGSTGHSTGPHLHFEAWQAGVNVTEAFIPNFASKKIKHSPEVALDKSLLRTIILSDGTIVIAEIHRKEQTK